MLSNVGQIGLLALALGAGTRGATGLYNLVNRNLNPPTAHANNAPLDVEFPVVGATPEDEEGFTPKMAFEWNEFLRGDYAKDWTGHPLGIPLATAAGTAGALGGWSLVDYVLDKRRKQQLEGELDDAKQRYESALAGTSKLGQALDRLAAECEKRSEFDLGNFGGQVAGAGMTAAGVGAMLAGLLAYQMSRKTNPKVQLQRAQKMRRRALQSAGATPIVAHTVPALG